MLARRSSDIALCRCGRERCERWCALLEFVLRFVSDAIEIKTLATTTSNVNEKPGKPTEDRTRAVGRYNCSRPGGESNRACQLTS